MSRQRNPIPRSRHIATTVDRVPVTVMVRADAADAMRSVLQAVADRVDVEALRPAAGRSMRPEFRASPDFRSVTLGGRQFFLTTQQAHIVQILHEAYANGTPELSQEYLLERIGSTAQTLRDVFRSGNRTPPAWGALVIPGSTRGSYRLNLP